MRARLIYQTLITGKVAERPQEREGKIIFVLYLGRGHNPLFVTCHMDAAFNNLNVPRKGQKVTVKGDGLLVHFRVHSWELAE